MRRLRLVILFLFFADFLFSQTVLLHEKVETDKPHPKYGQNLTSYFHFYTAAGNIAGPTESRGKVDFYRSTTYFLGLRYKLKLCSHYAWGVDFYFNRNVFGIKQYEWKVIPDTIRHQMQTLIFYNWGGSYFNRFNIERYRGNMIGKYIDLGASYDYTFSLVDHTSDKIDSKSNLRLWRSNLKYYNKYNGYVFIRGGINRYAIIFKYRFTDLFKAYYNYPELPRFSAGFELGFF